MKYSRLAGVTMIAPAALLLLIFFIAPVAYSFKSSLYDVGLRESQWVGLSNLISLLRPGPYWDSVRVTLKFLVARLLLDVGVAYAMALGLWKIDERVASTLRTCYYLPVMLSGIVTVSVWRWFLRYEGGAFNTLLEAINLPPVMWLGHPTIAPWSMCLILAMGGIGPAVLLYCAGLGQVNQEVIEAARMDGASELRLIWDVVTPLIRRTMIYVAVLNTISAFQVWEHPFFYTSGGPLGSTTTVAYRIYRTGFAENDLGMASAMTVVTVVLMLALAWVFIKRFGVRE